MIFFDMCLWDGSGWVGLGWVWDQEREECPYEKACVESGQASEWSAKPWCPADTTLCNVGTSARSAFNKIGDTVPA